MGQLIDTALVQHAVKDVGGAGAGTDAVPSFSPISLGGFPTKERLVPDMSTLLSYLHEACGPTCERSAAYPYDREGCCRAPTCMIIFPAKPQLSSVDVHVTDRAARKLTAFMEARAYNALVLENLDKRRAHTRARCSTRSTVCSRRTLRMRRS